MEDILYQIGLAFKSNKTDAKNRNFLNNQICIVLNAIYFFVSGIASTMTTDVETLLILGDFSHILHFKTHFAVMKSIAFSILMSNLVNSYIAHRQQEEQPFADLMRAVSGSTQCDTIGINNKEEFNRLKFKAKRLFLFSRLQCDVLVPVSVFIQIVFIFAKEATLEQLLMYCVPNTFVYTLFAVHFIRIITFQIFIFYCVCECFKIKLREVQKQLHRGLSNYRTQSTIKQMLANLHRIHCEIKQSNEEYWSRFLSVLWSELGAYISVEVYFLFYTPLDQITRLFVSYTLVVLILVFLFVIMRAASVNKMASKSHNLLGSHYVKTQKYFDSIKASVGDRYQILFKVSKIKDFCKNEKLVFSRSPK